MRLFVCFGILMVGTRVAAQQPATNPHGKLDEPCASCHSPEAWKPAKVSPTFDHAKKGFVLTGAHQQASCTACHTQLDFHGTARDCVGCHADAHRGELGTDCARCHTARSFLDRAEMARAHETTRFPLTGAHIATDCESCHPSGQQGRMTFTNRQTECQDCHITAYRATTDPNHTAVGFPTDCVTCHTPVAWASARFDHARTGFPLTGAHATIACSQCHGNSLATVLSTACVGCHQTDYNGAANPPHLAVGFPTDCSSCHTTSTWVRPPFDHSSTGWPLTGAHVSVSCGDCHQAGSTPTTACVSCHQQAYAGTTQPNHQAAAFPTDCSTCHTTVAWQPSTWDHSTYFPISSGAHDVPCSSCHTNSNDYRVFDCLSCHGKTETDSHHTGVSGYQYVSTECYRCHPRASGGG